MKNSLGYDEVKRQWVISGEPEMLMYARRIFQQAKKDVGCLRISDTLTNARDLHWFTQRYPLEGEHGSLLLTRMKDARVREAKIKRARTSPTPRLSTESFALPLRDYQIEAASFCTEAGRLLLADQLGLGKTVSAIGVMAKSGATPCVVVTATHLVHQWKAEINRFLPNLRVHIIKTGKYYDLTMTEGRVRSRTPHAYPDVVIINYHKLSKWADFLADHCQYVVFDECQELRTGDDSDKYIGALTLSTASKYCMGLSATPVFNYGGEFYYVISAIHPESLGTKDEFMLEYCTHAGFGKPTLRDPKMFGRMLYDRGYMLRRTREDIGRQLPPRQDIIHHVDMDDDALDAVSKDCAELARFLLSGEKGNRGEKMRAAEELSTRLRQATGISKAPHVASFVRMIVESCEAGEPVVLFGWHRAVFDIWLDALADLKPLLYTGTETAAQKEAAKAAFMRGDSKVLIVSLRSGVGLDGLQFGCKTVVFGELDWSYGAMDQCIGRVDRDGQKHSVFVYYLIGNGGADPTMVDVLGLKAAQLRGAISPEKDVVDMVRVDENHVANLAKDYLARREPIEA